MKPPKNTASTDPLVASAKAHFHAAGEALRKGCAEALITGLHLIALHARSNAGNGGGDRRSLTSSGGFESELTEIGIPKRTAYRWMNAATNALAHQLSGEPEYVLSTLPDMGSKDWHKWEALLASAAQGMSLNRLLLGTTQSGTDEHRYDELIGADEEGRQRATDLLQAVADGRYTLAQAVKALGSQEAYDRLRAEGGEKIRKDPVYLHFDPITKRSVGLIPKAFTTLHNGFQNWDGYDPDARHEMKRQWIEVIKTAPRELTDALRK